MHKKTWLLIVMIAFVLGAIAGGVFGISYYLMIKGHGKDVITDTWPRGDFVDPGPIGKECIDWMRTQEQDHSVTCELLDAKVGTSEKECLKGLSPAGCAICTIACT